MSNFESLTCCMNEDQEESEWKNDAKGEKKECDSDCFINRPQDGEAYPYCVLSTDLDWDDPITVQVCFLRYHYFMILLDSRHIIKS